MLFNTHKKLPLFLSLDNLVAFFFFLVEESREYFLANSAENNILTLLQEKKINVQFTQLF